MAESLKKPKKMFLHVLVFYKIIVLAFSKKKIKFACSFWFHKTIYKTHWNLTQIKRSISIHTQILKKLSCFLTNHRK